MKSGVALILLIVTVGAAEAAEPFSIRCDGKVGRPYFVTFDPDSKRVVFESTIRSFHKGEIAKLTDDSVTFSIAVDYGRIEFVWQPQRQTMVWAGISADPVRPLLSHNCASTELRTIFAVLDNPPMDAQPFSLRCTTLGQPYFVTMDRKTKAVVLEQLSGRTEPGEITSATERTVEMTIGHQQKTNGVWDRQARSVKWIGATGDHECEIIKTRTVLDLRLWP